MREAKKFGLDVSASEVDSAYASMASRMRYTPEQLTQSLASNGVNVATLKARIKADLAWPQMVRGRYQSSLQIGEKDLLTAMETKSDDTVGYDYTLRPILFSCRPDRRKRSSRGASARQRLCAAAFRAARTDSISRALKDVAVREQVVRSSADIPAELRKVLDGIEVGRLTPPEVTKFGIEMFAICAKKESSADNTPGKRKARESVMASVMSNDPSSTCKNYARRDARIQGQQMRPRAMARPLALTLVSRLGSDPTSPSPRGGGVPSSNLAPFYLLADPDFVVRRAQRIAPDVPIAVVEPAAAATSFASALPVVDIGVPVSAQPAIRIDRARRRRLPPSAAPSRTSTPGRRAPS